MNLGRYELVEKLASGGMAEVYLAKAQGPMGFQKKIVVKRILPHLAGDAAFSTMFLSEAKLAALLDHPHLVHIFDFGEADGSYFLAMEYIHGLNLSALLKRAKALGESLPFELCARIIAQVCEGLSYAHEFVDLETGRLLGLVHRDISPDNILVSTSGAVKVVDFGIAKATQQAVQSQTQTGILKGKVAYMSPEQVLGQPLDARADLYSLGTVLYELLGGRKPFETENAMGTMQAILSSPPTPITDHRADVPMSLQRILGRALAKERDARYANCRELHQDLERYLRTCGEPVGPFELAQLVSRLSGAGPRALPVTQAPAASPQRSPPSTTQLSAVHWTAQKAAPVPPPVQPQPATPRASPRSWRMALGGMGGLSMAMMSLWGLTRPVGTSLAEVRPSSGQASASISLAWVLPEAWLEERSPSLWTGVATSRSDEQPASPAPVLESRLAPARHRPGAASQSTLRIESNLKGMVRVNGQLLGLSPRTVRGLAPGSVDVELFDAQGTFAKRQSVTLKPGRQTVRMQVEKGTILLFNQPANTTVEVDGRALGVTPLPPIEVYEGSHSLAFINEKYGRRELKDYRVQAREQQVYRIAMKR